MGVDSVTASTIVGGGLGEILEAAVGAGGSARIVSNWLVGEVTAYIRREGRSIEETPLTGGALAELATLVESGDVSSSAAKTVLEGVLNGEGTPKEVAVARDLLAMKDTGALEAVVDEILAYHPDEAARLREGDLKVLGYLMGLVMRATGGKADPKAANEMLRSRA